MPRSRFFLKHKTYVVHPVPKRQSAYGKCVILIYRGFTARIDYIEYHRKREITAEIRENILQNALPLFKSMYGKGAPRTAQTQSAYQSRQSEHMVSMQMSNKYIFQS